MKPGDKMVVLTIDRIETLNASYYGNPQFRVYFTNGDDHRTQTDSQVNYKIRNSEYQKVPLEVILTRNNRIRDVRVAKK